MTDLAYVLLLAGLAGVAMPIGAAIANVERIRPDWLEIEIRHAVIAFGAGVLLAAVALVLVPEGISRLPTASAVLAFCAGGAVFAAIDAALSKRRGSKAQLLAMLVDFVPEAMALGAILAIDPSAGLLLALLIALQNLPEGFNAYRELVVSTSLTGRRIILLFSGLALLGPLAALMGFGVLAEAPGALGVIMMFAAGGILYLTVQDIAPQARMEHNWLPSLGAVAGFAVGLLGHALTS